MIGSKTTYPNEVEFKCYDGFELQGSATRKCEANGQWSGAIVKCKGTITNSPAYNSIDFLVVTKTSLILFSEIKQNLS